MGTQKHMSIEMLLEVQIRGGVWLVIQNGIKSDQVMPKFQVIDVVSTTTALSFTHRATRMLQPRSKRMIKVTDALTLRPGQRSSSRSTAT